MDIFEVNLKVKDGYEKKEEKYKWELYSKVIESMTRENLGRLKE